MHFVPTPGQTEQEYLGKYLAGRHLALCRPQKGFSLADSIASAGHFPFAPPELEEGQDLLRATIRDWLLSLTAKDERLTGMPDDGRPRMDI